MPLTIKFPTLITQPANEGFDNQLAMITNATGIFERYNNRQEKELLSIPTRRKTTVKVIKEVNASRMDLGQDHCLLVRVEEFKNGYDDMYLKSAHQPERDIVSTDKIGSRYNYALMYPYISNDNNGNNINRWVVFIYATPDKNDTDLINTIKYTISRILQKKFANKLDKDLSTIQTLPFVSVLLTNAENVDNEEIELNQYAVSAKIKSAKEVVYQNMPLDEAVTLNNEHIEDGFLKKIVKFFTTQDKKSYIKYEYETDVQGAVTNKLLEKYSYTIEVDIDDRLYEDDFMRQKFIDVLRHFLSNE